MSSHAFSNKSDTSEPSQQDPLDFCRNFRNHRNDEQRPSSSQGQIPPPRVQQQGKSLTNKQVKQAEKKAARKEAKAAKKQEKAAKKHTNLSLQPSQVMGRDKPKKDKQAEDEAVRSDKRVRQALKVLGLPPPPPPPPPPAGTLKQQKRAAGPDASGTYGADGMYIEGGCSDDDVLDMNFSSVAGAGWGGESESESGGGSESESGGKGGGRGGRASGNANKSAQKHSNGINGFNGCLFDEDELSEGEDDDFEGNDDFAGDERDDDFGDMAVQAAIEASESALEAATGDGEGYETDEEERNFINKLAEGLMRDEAEGRGSDDEGGEDDDSLYDGWDEDDYGYGEPSSSGQAAGYGGREEDEDETEDEDGDEEGPPPFLGAVSNRSGTAHENGEIEWMDAASMAAAAEATVGATVEAVEWMDAASMAAAAEAAAAEAEAATNDDVGRSESLSGGKAGGGGGTDTVARLKFDAVLLGLAEAMHSERHRWLDCAGIHSAYKRHKGRVLKVS